LAFLIIPLKPNSVRHALQIQFMSGDEESLVIAYVLSLVPGKGLRNALY
jgi:hypothetical protein